MAEQGSPLLGFERLCSEGTGTPSMTLCDLSFTRVLLFLKNFWKCIANAPTDEVLQESLLQVCADVNVGEGVDEIIFPCLDKV